MSKARAFVSAARAGRTGEVDRALTALLQENGFRQGTKGTAIVPSGATSIVVTHGLSSTPALADISVTATNNLGSAAQFWISTPTSTTFTINVDVDPGVTTATFVWAATLR